MSGFSFNHKYAVSTSSGEADYTYLADGTKVKVYGESNEDGYAYLGSLVFALSEGDWLFDSTPFYGGQIRKAGSSYVADRFATDHLGSVRALVRNGQVLERNDYYPYGMRHANSSLTPSSANRWRFSAKEIQTTAGVNLIDFGARLYDDRICRWTSQDPLAAKYPAFSPYAYCAGDPVNSIDLFGKKEWRINQKGEIVGEENNSQYDIIYMVDNNGNRILNADGSYLSISFKANSITDNSNPSLLLIKNSTGFDACDEKTGAALFQFLANNTSVEFGLITTNESSYVMTNHSEYSINVDSVAERMDNAGARIGLIMHSHPKNTPPSGYDIKLNGTSDKMAAQIILPLTERYVYLPKYNSVIAYDMFNYLKDLIPFELLFQ